MRYSAGPALGDPALDELDVFGRERGIAGGRTAGVGPLVAGFFLLSGDERADEARAAIGQGFEDAVAFALIVDKPRGDRAVIDEVQAAGLEPEATGVARAPVA